MKKELAVVIQYTIQAKISRHDRYYYCIVGYTCIIYLGYVSDMAQSFFSEKVIFYMNNGLLLKKCKIIKKETKTFIKSNW